MTPFTDLARRLRGLDRITALHATHILPFDAACRRGCAHCCTRNVTLTTLEGYAILDRLDPVAAARQIERLRSGTDHRRYRPRVTLNRLAAMARDDEPLPEEENDADWGPCPLLTESCCPIYRHRPFGCRAMVSGTDCSRTGFADMDPFVLTLNTVLQQAVEHLDRPGLTGNLTDVLLYLSSPENRRAYEQGAVSGGAGGLLRNRPVPVLMIPPRHHDRMAPVLAALRRPDHSPA